jgi:acetolactate synthase I/II/III large subunit
VRANDFPKTELTPDTDYAALAKACAGAGATVQNLGEVADAIRWALARTGEGRCAVLNVLLPQP